MMMYVTDSMLHWAAESVLALRPRLLVDISNGHRFHFNDAYLYITFAVMVLLLGGRLCYEAKERQSSLDHIPVYRASKWRWWFEAEDLLKESSAKYRNQVHQVDGPDGVQVVLPAKYIAEAKMMPDTRLDSEIATNEKLQTQYTGFPIANEKRDKLIALLRTKISPGVVSNLTPQLKVELEHLMSTEFPPCDDWTSMKWQPFGLRAIARLSGSVFVGTEVSRQREWTQTTIDFAMHVFIAGAKLSLVPSWARPLAQHFVGELGKIQKAIWVASEALTPILVEKEKGQYEDYVKVTSREETFLDSLIEALDVDERWDTKIQAELQLMLAAASIHTTGHVLCECMYELATRPELQEELRWEVLDVVCNNLKWGPRGWADGLQKLDSFMREVQRVHGNMAAFFRKAMTPITFSDGTYLPAGTSLFSPQAATSLDDQYYPEARAFDPFRFYNLRKHTEDGNRWQFTAPSDSNMHFGIGRHTCPGRYLASVEIKVILAHFLLNFEFRLKPGAQRPRPFALAMTKSPRQDAELEFRRRK